MLRSLITRATIVVAAASTGLIMTGGAAQAASSPHWQVSYRSHSAVTDGLASVTAPGKRDAWAVGVTSYRNGTTRPLVLHWNGSAWRTQAMPASFRPAFAESSSPHDVWILGQVGAIGQEALVWDGSTWTTVPLPQSSSGPFTVLSRSDVWADGEGSCTPTACTTTVWHWNGAAWTSVQVPGLVQDIAGAGSHAWLLTLTSLRRLSSGDPTGAPVIYRATGSTLARVTAPDHRIWDFAQLAAAPGGQLWMQASPGFNRNEALLFHWTGRTWADAKVPATVSSQPLILEDSLTYDGHDGVWAGPYAHWTGTKWINAFQVASMPGSDGFGLLGMATIPGSASIWGVGSVGRSASNHTQDSLIAVYGGTP
jgi:hypothetical protein